MVSTELYATLDEVKNQIQKGLAGDDAVITALIGAASRAIDNYTNHLDGFVALTSATARLYTGRGGSVQPIDECVEVTLVEVKESAESDDYTAWAATDWLAFRGDPEYPDFNNLPSTMLMVDPTGSEDIFTSGNYTNLRGFASQPDSLGRGVPTVRITAKWGYAVTVPPTIKEAAVIMSARWYKRGQSSWSDTLASGDFGQLQFRRAIDPDVKFMLSMGRYVKPPVG